jgi:hypothetical protein
MTGRSPDALPCPSGPLRVGFGWSGCDDALFSVGIRYMSRPGWAVRPLAKYSHMFLVFTFADPELNVIHEALGSSGWTGKPARKLDEWIRIGSMHRWAHIEWLEVPEDTVADIYGESCSWIGTRSYSWGQIAVLAVTHTAMGRALQPVVPWAQRIDVGEKQVMCAEGAGQLVGKHCPGLDLREPGESWAMLSPQDWADRYEKGVRRPRVRDMLETGDHGGG